MTNREAPPHPAEPSPPSPGDEDGGLSEMGRRLREARKTTGLSQEDVAQRTGIAVRTLARWEAGECEPGIIAVRGLGTLYGVSLDWTVGLTPIRGLIGAGCVMIDEAAVDAIRSIAEKGGGPDDIPAAIVRHPGFDYARVVPERLLVLSREAADRFEAQMRSWIAAIVGKRRSRL